MLKAERRQPAADRIEQLTDFFCYPDGEHNFDDWLRMILEDLLVIDAVTLAPTIDDHGTVWSSGKQARRFEVIDGATIKRVIDDMGRTPVPPAVAYQQILKGLPAIDFTADELVYRPRNLRAHKFYGYRALPKDIAADASPSASRTSPQPMPDWDSKAMSPSKRFMQPKALTMHAREPLSRYCAR